jgi:hypothetical protein
MVNKTMVKNKTVVKNNPTCGCSKGLFTFKGIISILLGLILWFGYLTVEQVIAIVLILLGLKKLYYTATCNC